MVESVEGLVLRSMIETREADVKRDQESMGKLYEAYFRGEVSLEEVQVEVDALNKLYAELILLKQVVMEAQWVRDGLRG
jgi:hypothetical protein